MSYNKTGYYARANFLQQIDRLFYQPYHDSCHFVIWKNYIYPLYFFSYQTYLKYLKAKVPPGFRNHPPGRGGLPAMAEIVRKAGLATGTRLPLMEFGEVVYQWQMPEEIPFRFSETEYQRSITAAQKAARRSRSVDRHVKACAVQSVGSAGMARAGKPGGVPARKPLSGSSPAVRSLSFKAERPLLPSMAMWETTLTMSPDTLRQACFPTLSAIPPVRMAETSLSAAPCVLSAPTCAMTATGLRNHTAVPRPLSASASPYTARHDGLYRLPFPDGSSLYQSEPRPASAVPEVPMPAGFLSGIIPRHHLFPHAGPT